MNMFAKSLEVIPKIIADNAGMDSLDIINKLRHRHCNNLELFQQKEASKTCIWVLILTLELEITMKPTFGNHNLSRSMLLRLPLKLLAPFFQLTRPLETQNLNKMNNKEESRRPFPELAEDESTMINCMYFVTISISLLLITLTLT